ncbi:MAG TPA: pyridoxal-phosphate dependent enzyme [Candidatus Pristimantibacillus sp.]|nr:pyridoxal-phosphate dependent enzyme [Candidatus Pristimantibacillus sp.]
MTAVEEVTNPYLDRCQRSEGVLSEVEVLLGERFDLEAYATELDWMMLRGGDTGPADMGRFERLRDFPGFPESFQPHFYQRSPEDTQGGIRPTPLEVLTLPDGRTVYDKREDTHEAVRAFKVRGALFAVLDAVAEHPEVRVFTTASTGNHAKGILYAVNMLNRALVESGAVRVNSYGEVHPDDAGQLFRADIYCTNKLDPEKREALENGGGRLIDRFSTLEEAMPAAQIAAKNDKSGRTAFIHPFNVENVIAGQGTIALELLLQMAAAGVNLRETPINLRVAVGGGGLYTGQQAVFRWAIDRGLLHPNSRVTAVEAENNDSANRELTGKPALKAHQLSHLAGGIATLQSGGLTVPVIGAYSHHGVQVVSEASMALAAEQLGRAHNGILPEFAGAVSLASVMQYLPDEVAADLSDVTITCGGNASARVAHDLAVKLSDHQDTRVAEAAAYIKSRVFPTLSFQILAATLNPVEVAPHPFSPERAARPRLRVIGQSFTSKD